MPTVLIVENNEDLAYILCETVRTRNGCRVITARDGTACLKLAAEEMPDAIILDAGLAGVNGFELCRLLKTDERTKSIPVILMVESVRDIAGETLEGDSEPDDYLVQPVTSHELTNRVRAMLKVKKLIDTAARTTDSTPVLSPDTAHKLRSPLNSIIGMAELIQKPFYGDLNNKQKEFVQIISRSGHRLLDLINELADE